MILVLEVFHFKASSLTLVTDEKLFYRGGKFQLFGNVNLMFDNLFRSQK